MAHYNYIDIVARGWGEKFFGKEAMEQISDEQISEARIEAFEWVHFMCRNGVKLQNGVIEKYFCDYIQQEYMRRT